jgi:uncharacterized protein (TIGR02001 family)
MALNSRHRETSPKGAILLIPVMTARARGLPPWLLALLALGSAPTAPAADLGSDIAVGGDLAVTSDYIYRGLSESNGHAAVQADLHADLNGTFLGAWASTRDHTLDPYADYDVEVYLGHRFALAGSWSATLDVRSHYFVGGPQGEGSADYQQATASVSYLDRWTVSIGAIPNAVHYWFEERVGRSLAWFAETSGQWLVLGEGFFLTAGAGYYQADGTGPRIRRSGGYAYGDAGVAFECRRWRVDVGYFFAQHEARRLFPYPISDALAATLTWRF